MRAAARLPKPPLGSYCIFDLGGSGRSRARLLSLWERRGEGLSDRMEPELVQPLTLTLSQRERGPDVAFVDFLNHMRTSLISEALRFWCTAGATRPAGA